MVLDSHSLGRYYKRLRNRAHIQLKIQMPGFINAHFGRFENSLLEAVALEFDTIRTRSQIQKNVISGTIRGSGMLLVRIQVYGGNGDSGNDSLSTVGNSSDKRSRHTLCRQE